MTVTAKDDSITRGIMFLCLGASALLLIVQWRVGTPAPGMPLARAEVVPSRRSPTQKTQTTSPPKPATPASNVSAKPVSQPTSAPVASPADGPNLVVDLSDRRVYVYQNSKRLTSYPLAVGQAGWETPTGNFQVIEMQRDPQWLHPITKEVFPAGPDNPLGKRWIGFWADGETHIGFHGTNQEELIGTAVSHGCLRMRNRDVIALYDKVSEGTSVVVRP